MSLASILNRDLCELGKILEQATAKPDSARVVATLTPKLLRVQQEANTPDCGGLLDALVDLAGAIVDIRIKHPAEQDPLSRLPVPQYDLAIPFKAIDVQGDQEAVYDAESVEVINSCVPSLLAILSAGEQAQNDQDGPAPTQGRADA